MFMTYNRSEIRSHLADHLGPCDLVLESGRTWQLLRFPNEPMVGCATYVSLGLSAMVLKQDSGIFLRQEILTSIRDGQCEAAEVIAALVYLALHVENGEPLVRRSLHPISEGAFRKAPGIVGAYITSPAYFDDEMKETQRTNPQTIFAGVVFVNKPEMSCIARSGGKQFEGILEREDPDLTDIAREPHPAFLRF